MATSKFLQGSENITSGSVIDIITYQVHLPQTFYIQQVSIDLSPANYFPDILFNLLINGVPEHNFNNINSQITQSYFPLSLPTPIKVSSGSIIKWQITGLASLGSNTCTAYCSLLGELKP